MYLAGEAGVPRLRVRAKIAADSDFLGIRAVPTLPTVRSSRPVSGRSILDAVDELRRVRNINQV